MMSQQSQQVMMAYPPQMSGHMMTPQMMPPPTQGYYPMEIRHLSEVGANNQLISKQQYFLNIL